MNKSRTIARFLSICFIGGIILSAISGSFGWPSKEHAPGDQGTLYNLPSGQQLSGTITGKFGGTGDFVAPASALWGKKNTTTGVDWGVVDTFLPQWDFSGATYSVYPFYFVKEGALDNAPRATLNPTSPTPTYTRTLDLKTNSKYTLGTPFGVVPEEGPWYGDELDEYQDPTFKIASGNITTGPITPNYAYLEKEISYNLLSQVGGAADMAAAGGSVMRWECDAPCQVGAVTEAKSTLHMNFQMPFNDAQYGHYSATLVISTPTTIRQLGPSVIPKDSWADITADYLKILSSQGDSFYYMDWGPLGGDPPVGEPPAIWGGQNIPKDGTPYNVYIGGDYGNLQFDYTTMSISWVRDPTHAARRITDGNIFEVDIKADIGKDWWIFTIIQAYNYYWIDYAGLTLSYDSLSESESVGIDTVLPLPIRISHVENASDYKEFTRFATFPNTYVSGKTTWEVSRTAAMGITEFTVQLKSITARYYTHLRSFSRVNGVALNGRANASIYDGVELMNDDGVKQFYFSDLDKEPFYVENSPTPFPSGTARVRLAFDIVGPSGEYRQAPYYYDYLEYNVSAHFDQFYTDFDISYTGAFGFATHNFPDMTWMRGNFTRYYTTDSPYIVTLTTKGIMKGAEGTPVFKGYVDATDPNPLKVDLPLWDMVFPAFADWSCGPLIDSFVISANLDGGPDAIPVFDINGYHGGLAWPGPDESVFLNVGSMTFTADYKDVNTPVVAGILWWERFTDTKGGQYIEGSRDYTVMDLTATDGVGLEGYAEAILYPEEFAIGVYHFYFEIIDGGGSYKVSDYRTYIIMAEGTAPFITIVSPHVSPGSQVVYGLTSGVPTFEAKVWDVNLDPSTINVSVNGLNFSLSQAMDELNDPIPDYYVLNAAQGDPAMWDAWTNPTTGYWSLLQNGSYPACFYAMDTNGNLKQVNFTLTKDYEVPEYTISYPAADLYVPGLFYPQLFVTEGYSWVEGILYSFDASPIIGYGTWYLADIDPQPAPVGHTFAFNVSAWYNVSEGPLKISFTVVDTGGNFAPIQSINVFKDSISPRVVVLSPASNLIASGSAPFFHILVSEEIHLSYVAYCVDGYDFRYIDLGTGLWSEKDKAWSFTGTLNQSDWDSLPDEASNILIRFFVIDGAYNFDQKDLQLTIDRVGPRISIISPVPGAIVSGFAASYLIEVVEPHLQALWYSFDNGTTLVPIAKLSDVFDQARWDAMADVTKEMRILFIGRDTLGNYGYAEVTVIRSDFLERGRGIGPGLFVGMPWQVILCMTGAAGVLFAINAWNKRRVGGR